MSVEYLGIVRNVISADDLRRMLGVSMGSDVYFDDIPWLKFIYNGKILLISSYVLTTYISYNSLNELGIVNGKNISILEKNYSCRLPYMFEEGTYNVIGREWKDCIVDFCSDDKISNWSLYSSLALENDGKTAFAIGKNSITYRVIPSTDAATTSIGWRPVLELLDIVPEFSISDSDLGDITHFDDLSYTVTDEYSNTFLLTEKLDENIIRRLDNQTSGTNYTLDLSSIWDSIRYGKNTVEITATDLKGLSSTVTVTFNKIKEPIKYIATDANYNQIKEHNKEIKKELEYQDFKLRNYLSEKGIEVTNEDKMSTLIDKISGLGKKIPKWMNDASFMTVQGAGIPYSSPEFGMCAVNKNVHIIGGYSPDTKSNYKYNPITNTFEKMPDLPYDKKLPLCIDFDTSIYICGGNFNKNAFEFNVITQTYINKNDATQFYVGGVYMTKPFKIDENTVITFGYTNYGSNYYNVAVYNKLSDTWNNNYTTIPVQGYSCGAKIKDTIYFLPGSNVNIYTFDYHSKIFTEVGRTSQGSFNSYAQCVGFNEDIYFFTPLGFQRLNTEDYSMDVLKHDYSSSPKEVLKLACKVDNMIAYAINTNQSIISSDIRNINLLIP